MSERDHSVVGALTGDRRALVDQWHGNTGHSPGDPWRDGPLPHQPTGEAAPLSYAQERLWFLEHLRPGQSLYVVPVLLRLSLPVSAPIVQRALDEIVRRH